MQVNPDNSRAMSALTFFIIQIKDTANKNRQRLSQPKPWCNDSAWCIEFTLRLLHHDNDVKMVVSSQPSVMWHKSTNQKIGIRTVYEKGLFYSISAFILRALRKDLKDNN